MCYKIYDFLGCQFCDEYAIVYKICTDNSGRVRDCNDCFAPTGNHEVIFTKSDDATDITFICGMCNIYIGHGYSDRNMEFPYSREEILECTITPLQVIDYMMKVLLDKQPSEDAGMCGYKNENGDTIVILCTYEYHGDYDSIIIFPRHNKRRRCY